MKFRFRLYSASGFAARVALLFADVLLAAAFFPEAFFVEAFFAEAVFAAEDFRAGAFPVVFALLFFAAGRFTVRLRMVAMLAPWCEEHAEQRNVRRSEGEKVGNDLLTFRPPDLLTS